MNITPVERVGRIIIGAAGAVAGVVLPPSDLTALPARPATASPRRSSRRSWWILGGVTVTSFFLLVSDTALIVALPSARAQMGVSLPGLQWVVNSYTLALAALLLVGGRLSDLIGPRRVYLGGLSVFILASLAAGLSPGLTPLLISRVVQGVGAALIMPATLAIIVSVFPASQRVGALGVWAGVSAAALALGPLVGTALIVSLDWKWLFFINLPPGIAALFIGARLLPTASRATKRVRFDILGAVTSGLGLVAILYAVTQAGAQSWASPSLLGSFVVGVASLGLFVFIERRSSRPILDLSLFRRPSLAAANAIGLLSQAVMCGMFFFMSLYLQAVLSYSNLATGLTSLPLTLPLLIAALLAGKLMHRVGARVLVVVGLALLAVALLALSRATASGSLWMVVPAYLVAGAGIGLSTTPTTTLALEALPESHAGLGAGLLNASRTAGLALGIALMGVLVAMGGPSRSEAIPRDFTAQLSMGLLIFAAVAAGTVVVAVVFLKRPISATVP